MSDIMSEHKSRTFQPEQPTPADGAVEETVTTADVGEGEEIVTDQAPEESVKTSLTGAPEDKEEPLPTGTSGAEIPGVTEKDPRAGDKTVAGSSPFTVINIEDNGNSFAKQWLPSMDTPSYIGETSMLLQYLQRLERKHKVTMPIKACGIDPILFENVEYMGDGSEGRPKVFPIGDDNQSEGTIVPHYELIQVDGDLYLSCVTECLDEEYLNRIISDATAQVKETGSYVYQMTGYRKLALAENATTATLLNTLRLNTYEMSVLISYMQQFEGLKVSFEAQNNHQCICFKK